MPHPITAMSAEKQPNCSERQAMNEERTIMLFTVLMVGLAAAAAVVVAFFA